VKISQQYKSFEEFLAEIDSAENPQLRLFEITLERARQKSVELAEALRYCAIPQRFNAEIIGILEPVHSRLASGLMKKLREYDFVLEREKGWYVYHDNTRDLLLEDWRTGDNKADFIKYNERIIKYYEVQIDYAKKAENDWKAVAQIIHVANPDRYKSLATTIERQFLTILVEILYHKMLLSAESGYTFFENQFYELEKDKSVLCLTLLNVTRNFLLKLILPGTIEADRLTNLNLWLDYFEARLNQKVNTFDTHGLERVKDSLETLIQKTGVQQDFKLYLWTLNQLGSVLTDLTLYNKAYEAYCQSLSLSEDHKIDLYNQPVFYSNLAFIHQIKGQLSKAFEYYEVSVVNARKENNKILEISSLYNQCNIFQEQGKWSAAFTKSLETLHEVWTRFPQEVSFHYSVLWNFFYLIPGKDPQHLDCTFKGIHTYLEIYGDQRAVKDLHLRYISLLIDSGRIRQAEIELNIFLKESDRSSNPKLEMNLLYQRGFLYKAQGNLQQTIKQFDELNNHPQATAWDKGAANTNLGLYYLQSSHWELAKNHLLTAISHWEQMGFDKLVASTKIMYAELLIKLGKLNEAQTQLDICKEALFKEFHKYQISYHSVQGMLYEARKDWPSAYEQYNLVIEKCLLTDSDIKNASERYGDLARVHGNQANWKEAAECTKKAHLLWRKLMNANNYQPTQKIKKADKFFTDGLNILFVSSDETWNNRINAAQEQWRNATRLLPQNIIYAFYWMYASAELQGWLEAIQAVNIIFDHGPQWACEHPFLEARLVEYSLRQGTKELESNNCKMVSDLYSNAEQRLKSSTSLNQIANGWIEFGDYQLSRGEPKEAQARYFSGLNIANRTKNTEIQADCYTRLGYLAIIYADKFELKDTSGKQDEVLVDFTKAIHLYRLGNLNNPGFKLSEICKARIQRIEQYWQLDSRLNAYTNNKTLEKDLRDDLTVAQESLLTYLNEVYQLSGQSAETVGFLPIVNPIAVEIDMKVLPEGPDSEWKLFKTYIPDMRTRIQNDMGVKIPGIRIRGNDTDLQSGSYLIMLDEVPVQMGFLESDKVYCVASLETLEAIKIPESALLTKPHPLTAIPGFWVDNQYKDILIDNGYDVWDDPLLFMIYHLEAILRRNLAQFLGLQEVEKLLSQWQETEEGDLVKAVLSNSEAKQYVARLLRALVKENVPVKSWEKIMEAIRDKELMENDINAMVNRVRLQLKEELPGNNAYTKLINLPFEIENQIANWIWPQNKKTYLAIPPEDTQELLSQIRELVNSNDVNQVLVVQKSEVRPFVRRLVELEYPFLMVLSQEELFY
jgi:tetratricopeptide (TPR) repeat protein